jgi:DNA-binding NarL/FixJ family response regulator
MFKKVLVVEDIDSINIGVVSALSKAFDFEIDQSKYCDEALLKTKKSIKDGNPYDLLITDLSFKEDYRPAKIISGEQLVVEIRKLLPEIKTIIYSIEDRPFKIKEFTDLLGVNGYVLKGRESSRELIKAIEVVNNENTYICSQLAYVMHTSPAIEIEEYDLKLIKELANGLSQQEIAKLFKRRGINPSSLSSIEKRLNNLKDNFMAKNTTHLVAIAKDLGLF